MFDYTVLEQVVIAVFVSIFYTAVHFMPACERVGRPALSPHPACERVGRPALSPHPACERVGRPALSPHPRVALLGKFDCRERKQADRHRQVDKLIMTLCMDAYT